VRTTPDVPWPGPVTWHRVWYAGFPTTLSAGDLYMNLSGLRYICNGKEWIMISDKEWDEYLEDQPDDS
jgi:hypothetical protein